MYILKVRRLISKENAISLPVAARMMNVLTDMLE
jgi:hypothetical protein